MMTHEMAEPTDALDEVVRRVIVPRIDYMRELVADILDVRRRDDRVLRCVLSVQSQFHAAMANPVSKRLCPGSPAIQRRSTGSPSTSPTSRSAASDPCAKR